MFNIVIGVLSFNLILVVFKFLERYNVNNLQTLFYNYLVAGCCGIYYSREFFSVKSLFQSDFSIYGFLIGGFFIGSFLLLAMASQKIGMGIATTANKMSVVLPVIAAIILLNDTLNSQKTVGIVLAVVAVYFVTTSGKGIKLSKSNLILLALIFIGQGIADIFFALAQSWHVQGNERGLFFTCIFLSASFIGLGIISYQLLTKQTKIDFKALFWGILLGLLNFSTLFFFFAALEEGSMESSQVYPIFNMAVILIAAFVGFFFFNEKLQLKNWLGIVIAILSIFLLGFDF